MTAVAAVSGAHVAGGPRLLGILLAGYLVLGQSVVGGWSHARFRRMLGRDPRALLSRYRRTAVVEWSLVAVALALVAAAPGLGLADIGVRWPRLSDGGAPFTMVGLGGLGLSVLLLAALRSRVDGGVPVTAPVEVLALLPRSTRERRAFAAVAVTAGVCEETLYRGVLLAAAAGLLARRAQRGRVRPGARLPGGLRRAHHDRPRRLPGGAVPGVRQPAAPRALPRARRPAGARPRRRPAHPRPAHRIRRRRPILER